MEVSPAGNSQRDVKLFSDPAGISQREIHPQLTGAAGAKRAKDSLSLAPKLGRIAWQTIIAIIRCVDKFGVVGKNHAEFNPEGGTVLQLKQLPSLLGHCTSGPNLGVCFRPVGEL